jgi:hypothetical protein
MKRAGTMLVWVAGMYVVLMLGSGLLIKALLTGGRIDAVVHSLNARMPVAVSVAEGSFDLMQWFRFQPVIRLRKISLANPAGFSAEPLLAVAEAGAQVDLLSPFKPDLRVPSVDLREPALNIETDGKGNTNIAAMLATAAEDAKGQGAGGGTNPSRGVTIDRVSVTGGTIRYQGQGTAPGANRPRYRVVAFRFRRRQDCEGSAGRADSLPAQGTLSLLLAPAEIPKALRDKHLGDLAGEPPPLCNWVRAAGKAPWPLATTVLASLARAAAPRLRRIGRNHLDAQFAQRPARSLYSAQNTPCVSTTSRKAAITVRVASSSTNCA